MARNILLCSEADFSGLPMSYSRNDLADLSPVAHPIGSRSSSELLRQNSPAAIGQAQTGSTIAPGVACNPTARPKTSKHPRIHMSLPRAPLGRRPRPPGARPSQRCGNHHQLATASFTRPFGGTLVKLHASLQRARDSRSERSPDRGLSGPAVAG